MSLRVKRSNPKGFVLFYILLHSDVYLCRLTYAGIYQSVQGEIGFWVDTRVYGTQVQQIPQLSTWYGTAQVADKLTGNGLLNGCPAEIGGLWNTH